MTKMGEKKTYTMIQLFHVNAKLLEMLWFFFSPFRVCKYILIIYG